MPNRIYAALAALLIALPLAAQAEVAVEGRFVARLACHATQNIKAGTNPGNVMTQAGRSYPVHAANRRDATHYRIEVEGAEPRLRWVAAGCGAHLATGTASKDEAVVPRVSPLEPAGLSKSRPQPTWHEAGVPEYLLAITWAPAFCETHRSKPECRSQSPGRYDARHLSLHGLWPQPKGNFYCNVPAEQKSLDESGRYGALDPIPLKPETRRQLERVMPGTRSNLHRHEWVKHGSCFADGDPEAYFQASIAMMNAINGSAVRDLLAANVGGQVTARSIRHAFDDAFGQGAGSRVAVTCDGGMIRELRIELRGRVDEHISLADLIHAAEPASAAMSNCRSGRVDRAGFGR